MTAFTSKATGNWSASGQTTWNESGVPGNGDTVAIGAGHVITVTANATVGTSPAPGTDAITIANTGKLVIDNDIKLTVRGDVTLTGAATRADHIVMNEGSEWEFDGSAAGSPSTAAYGLHLTTFNSLHAQLKINGVSGNRCTFTSNAGGANGKIDQNGWNGGSIDAAYCDFSKLGSASANGIECYSYHAQSQFKMVHCTVDSCGTVDQGSGGGGAAGAIIHFEDVIITNSLRSYAARFSGTDAAPITTGTRLISLCSFDTFVGLSGRDFTITGNYFHDQIVAIGSHPWALCEDNFFRDSIASVGLVLYGNTADCYWLENHTNSNPHGIQPFGIDANQTISGVIFEHTGTNNPGAGDFIVLGGNPASPRTLTVTGCILLPNAADHTPGKIVALLGGANVTAEIEHNTYFSEGTGETGVAYGETYDGHAGMISKFRSNLAWGPGSSGLKLNQIVNTGTPTDTADPDFVDYNAGWGLQAGTEGGGYNKLAMTAPMFTGTRGVDWAAHDLDGVDPEFVDDTRDLGSWGAANESTDGSVGQALAVLRVSPSKIPGMILWVKAGFVPMNAAYATAGHDGTAPGAMPYVAPPSSPRNPLNSLINTGDPIQKLIVC